MPTARMRLALGVASLLLAVALVALPTTLATPARAEPGLPPAPRLIKDIAPGTTPLDANPAYLTIVGDQLLFFAQGASGGYGLWASDGTAEGTQFIWASGLSSWAVRGTAALGDSLLFVLMDEDHGAELWRSDGTPEGTALVVDLYPGPEHAFGAFEVFPLATARQIFFVATDGARGWGLWASDGTAAGTVMLRELAPVGANNNPPPLELIAVGEQVFFRASDPEHGAELWVSDGTPAGTRLVRDINPGPAAGAPHNFAAVGATLLFFADDGAHGVELWRSDGTEAGTELVADLNPGAAGSQGWQMATLGDEAYFFADDGASGRQVWRSDGTLVGTAMLTRPGPTQPAFGESVALHSAGGHLFVVEYTSPRRVWSAGAGPELTPLREFPDGVLEFASLGEQAIFAVRESYGQDKGLWLSDGSAAGTSKLVDLQYPTELTAHAGVVYFLASEPARPRTLWRTDGTVAGTRAVRELREVPASSYPSCATVYGGRLYFNADDGVHGKELWVSDGTPDGTRMLVDLAPGAGSASPCEFVPFGGALTFVAQGKLWRTDGTAAGTRPIVTAEQPDGVAARGGVTVVGARGYFTAGQQNSELWVLDADLQSARLVRHFPLSGKYGGYPLQPRYAVGTRLVFAITDLYGNNELWSSDGTAEGTRLIARQVAVLGPVRDRLLFIKIDVGKDESALWTTDGTDAGTAQLATLPGRGGLSGAYSAATTPGRVFFSQASYSDQPWVAVSDGTAAGTRILARPPGNLSQLVAGAGVAYFVARARDADVTSVLWRTDGSTGGTAPVHQPGGDVPLSPFYELVMLGRQLIFVSTTAAGGVQLWTSDGTAAGTRRLSNFSPSIVGWPRLFGRAMVVGDQLIFAADDGVHGDELWGLPLAALGGWERFYLPQLGVPPQR